MSLHTEEHPLVEYLEREGIKPWRFADLAGISRVTIYKLIAGREPSVSTLTKIEDATEQKITMRMCVDFYNRRKALGDEPNGR